MAENKNTYIDRDTGEKVALTDAQYDFLADADSKLGGPRYAPTSGSVSVAIQDDAGDVHVRDLDAGAYHAARKGGKNVARVTDDNRADFEVLQEQGFQRRTEESRALGAGGFEVFAENLIPGARSMQRAGMTEEQQARHGRIQELEDADHAGAALAGDVGQLVATSLIPIPGLGVAGNVAARGTQRIAGKTLATQLERGGIKKVVGTKTPTGVEVAAGAGTSEKAALAFGRAAKRSAEADLRVAKGYSPSLINANPASAAGTEVASSRLGQLKGDFFSLGANTQELSAMSLLGFSRDVGNLARAGVASKAPGLPAQLAGSVAAGATVNLPLALQYEAAQAYDYNKPLVSETLMQDVGTDMLIGMAIDAAFPLLGRGAQTLFRMSPAIDLLGQVSKLGKQAVAKKTGRRFASVFPTPKSSGKRLVGKKGVDAGIDATTRHSRALSAITPSNAYTPEGAKKAAKALDELAELTPEVTSMPEFSYLKANIGDLAGINGAVDKMGSGLIDTLAGTADAMSGHIRDLNLSRVSFKNAPTALRFQIRAAVNTIEQAASPEARAFLDSITEGLTSHAGPVNESVQRLLNFRNRIVLGAKHADGASAELVDIVRQEVDSLLANPANTGDAANDLMAMLRSSDDVINATGTLRDAGALKNYGAHMSPEDVDLTKYLDAIDGAERGYDTLNQTGAFAHKGNNASFAQSALARSRTSANKAAPKLKAAQQANVLHGASSQHFQTNALPSPDATKAGIIRGAVNWVGDYMRNVKSAANALLHIDTPIARGAKTQAATAAAWSAKDYGVWKYRNMNTREEKREAFNAVRTSIKALTANADTLQGAATALTGSIQADQELSQAAAMASVQKLQYLANQLPQAPQGIVGGDDIQFSPAEESTFLEIYGAADNPLSVMETIGTGTLSEDALRAVAMLYPTSYADMQMELSETIAKNPENYKKLPFAVRTDIDTFLGGGYVQANQPSTFVNFQDKSSQTEAQNQAINGRQGQMRSNPQPLGSDNLAKL